MISQSVQQSRPTVRNQERSLLAVSYVGATGRWTTHLLGVLCLLTITTLAPSIILAQGAIASGETLTGTITPAGETDSWTFSANTGDAIVVRVGETATTAFSPKIQLLSPTSVLLGTSTSTVGAEIAVTATNSGTFSVIVSDNAGTQTGDYRLTVVRTGAPVVVSPGDEGGPLTNG